MRVSLKKSISGLIVAGALLGVARAAQATEAGDWLLRLRGIAIMPTSEGKGISPDLPAGGLDPQITAVPELDVTYMATENIGIELIAAISKHDLEGTGSIAAVGDAASVWLLPPTLLLQYHFLPKETFRPYVGAGINYTIAFGENASQTLDATLGPTDLDIGNSVGWAVQAGFDLGLSDRWFVNVDLKYIDMEVDTELRSPGITRTLDVDINPVVLGIGVGYRF